MGDKKTQSGTPQMSHFRHLRAFPASLEGPGNGKGRDTFPEGIFRVYNAAKSQRQGRVATRKSSFLMRKRGLGRGEPAGMKKMQIFLFFVGYRASVSRI